uniref:6.8 kDa mitochondrial proteolipid n=1 Tax=Fundulus heteroclitus TaxID=8078 RepID=A0A3Q2PNQ4_FUNHE
MVGSAFSRWWTKLGPYYTKAYPEMWVGVALTAVLYFKISYGGNKPVSHGRIN